MKAWNLGNTTVRNPYRLKDGLRVLVHSPLHGNLTGREQEARFAHLLNEAGVVDVQRLRGDVVEDSSDVGRKWRAALTQLGFITPKLSRTLDQNNTDPRLLPFVAEFPTLSGRPHELTPNGQRLLDADAVVGEQDVFLRALCAYRLPSVIEPRSPGGAESDTTFSPLRIVLEILVALAARGLVGFLSFEEMAWIVQLTRGDSDVAACAERIAGYRREHEAAEHKKRFEQQYQARVMASVEGQSSQTLDDYADLNLRYLKATGLFAAGGRGIAIAEQRRPLVQQLLAVPLAPYEDAHYLHTLWRGATLPTDSAPEAVEAILALAGMLAQLGQPRTLPDLAALDLPILTTVRLDLDEQLRHLHEQRYAALQRDQWQDIVSYLRALSQSTRSPLVPRGEAPAYLEWGLWRAFLAIDALVNLPWEARRFQVDQDFLPVGTAPGGSPDMTFEFQEFVLVVEVTLTASSRQEAAEGEPVRRHVAAIAERFASLGKAVYGLFIANTIDSNTAETLRIGSWYGADDVRTPLRIVPLTLAQFLQLFEAGFQHGTRLSHATIEKVLLHCLADRNADAPQWKERINAHVRIAAHDLANNPT